MSIVCLCTVFVCVWFVMYIYVCVCLCLDGYGCMSRGMGVCGLGVYVRGSWNVCKCEFICV